MLTSVNRVDWFSLQSLESDTLPPTASPPPPPPPPATHTLPGARPLPLIFCPGTRQPIDYSPVNVNNVGSFHTCALVVPIRKARFGRANIRMLA